MPGISPDPDEFSLTHPTAAEYFAAFNDLQMPQRFRHVQTPSLPAFIPQSDRGQLGIQSLRETTGLPLSRFMSPREASFQAGNNLVTQWKDSGSAQIFLVTTNNDEILETLWTHKERFVNAVQSSELDLVAAPAFSVYDTDQPIQHRLSLIRSAHVYGMLTDAGIPTAFPVGFTTRVDAAQIGIWATENRIECVFLDLQSTKTEQIWNRVRTLLPIFVSEARSVDQYILNGVADFFRIQDLLGLFHLRPNVKVTFTTTEPYFMATKGLEYFRSPGPIYKRMKSSASKSDILANLIRSYDHLCVTGNIDYQPVGVPWRPKDQQVLPLA